MGQDVWQDGELAMLLVLLLGYVPCYACHVAAAQLGR